LRTFIGIDLGSTTTKAVLLDENLAVLGRGITNSRSNYDVAARVSKQEAKIGARFTLFRKALGTGRDSAILPAVLERNFRLEQFLSELGQLEQTCDAYLDHPRFQESKGALRQALDAVFRKIEGEAPRIYAPGADRKSDFFRDIAGSRFMNIAETVCREAGIGFDFTTWFGWFAPAGVPPDIVRRVNGEIAKLLADSQFNAKFIASQGLASDWPTGASPEDFDKFIKTDLEGFVKLAKTVGLKQQ